MQQPQQPGYYLDAQTLPAYQPFAVPTSIPSYPNGPAMDSKSGPVPPPPPPSQEEGLPSYGSLARQTDDSTSQNPDGVSDDQTARDGEPRRP